MPKDLKRCLCDDIDHALGVAAKDVKPPLTVPFKSRHHSKVASHIFPRRFVA